MMTIDCFCGRKAILRLVGGQYQDDYRGDCECGRKWLLQELSEALEEISDLISEHGR